MWGRLTSSVQQKYAELSAPPTSATCSTCEATVMVPEGSFDLECKSIVCTFVNPYGTKNCGRCGLLITKSFNAAAVSIPCRACDSTTLVYPTAISQQMRQASRHTKQALVKAKVSTLSAAGKVRSTTSEFYENARREAGELSRFPTTFNCAHCSTVLQVPDEWTCICCGYRNECLVSDPLALITADRHYGKCQMCAVERSALPAYPAVCAVCHSGTDIPSSKLHNVLEGTARQAERSLAGIFHSFNEENFVACEICGYPAKPPPPVSHPSQSHPVFSIGTPSSPTSTSASNTITATTTITTTASAVTFVATTATAAADSTGDVVNGLGDVSLEDITLGETGTTEELDNTTGQMADVVITATSSSSNGSSGSEVEDDGPWLAAGSEEVAFEEIQRDAEVLPIAKAMVLCSECSSQSKASARTTAFKPPPPPGPPPKAAASSSSSFSTLEVPINSPLASSSSSTFSSSTSTTSTSTSNQLRLSPPQSPRHPTFAFANQVFGDIPTCHPAVANGGIPEATEPGMR